MVLYRDRLEYRRFTTFHVVERNRILGWRIASQTFPAHLLLEWKDTSRKQERIPLFFHRDTQFLQWMEGLEDLDTKQRTAEHASIVNDPAIGDLPASREESLRKTRIRTNRLNLLGLLLFFWGLFHPRPYPLIAGLLLASPWLCALIVWRSNGLIHAVGDPSSVRPQLASLVIIPPILLALLAIAAFAEHLLYWEAAFAATLIIGALLSTAFWKADPSLRDVWYIYGFFLLVTLPYGYGAALHLNRLIETADVRYHPYTIAGKRTRTGQLARHQLLLTPATPDSPPVEYVNVSQASFKNAKTGDPFCLSVHRGALTIQWIAPEYASPRCP